jgi:hypothetical protein
MLKKVSLMQYGKDVSCNPSADLLRPCLLLQVAHLVIVETDRMFYLRNMREYYQQVPRPTLVIDHGKAAQAHMLQQQQQQQLTHTSGSTVNAEASASASPVASSSRSSFSFSTLPPLQSPYVRHHLKEHLPPLPEGSSTTWAGQVARGLENMSRGQRLQLVRKDLADLIKKRGEAAHKLGPFHPQLAETNARIMQLREEQDSLDSGIRKAYLRKLHRDHGGVKPVVRGASGMGSRRGMLKQQQREAPERAQKLAQAAQQRWLQRQQKLLEKYEQAQAAASPG